ncbi:uncharacterized protein [Oryza sativa Japonica Group]|uniref:Uncharacterized protein n=2 Tax=Oryza TaxID=4527 RepID=A3ADD8_ORYSJ|nr:uncharacterized protein LOC4331365 isoform X2 [Oryza sativa Japonica Group]EAZ25327.1 hypothetical protein OsJ_09139 [Oryza sativa Japonica Group]
MASPPAAAPPEWVVLDRLPLTSIDLPKDGISLSLVATPRISQLLVSPSLGLASGSVLAADPSGILLLSSSDPFLADSKSYVLWDAVYKISFPVPATPTETGAATGLVVVPGGSDHIYIMVAELSIRGSDVILRCFSTDPAKWIHKILQQPPQYKLLWCWCSDYALSHQGRLWWVDLLQGLVACDPFSDNPELHFVPLPSCCRNPNVQQSCRMGLSDNRRVGLSRGKLRLVVLSHASNSKSRIRLWTLADSEAGHWTLDFDLSSPVFDDIWTDLCDWKIAFFHPSKPHVVYFSQKQHLVAVDLQMVKVSEEDGVEPCSSSHVLAWELSPSLRTTLLGPSPAQDTNSTSHFDSVANSFLEAYSSALVDMEFHQLATTALASLNKEKKRTEENKFKLSERLLLQTFLDQTETSLKKYAHLNFYAGTGSEKVLVFAEFHTDAVGDNEPDEWGLSSCKLLRKNYQGGLYGEDADRRLSMRANKRKKSIYCFACAAEMLHPINGFDGGYAGMSVTRGVGAGDSQAGGGERRRSERREVRGKSVTPAHPLTEPEELKQSKTEQGGKKKYAFSFRKHNMFR